MISIFKLKSRLGLLHAPHRQKDINLGVEDAPDAILSKEFISTLPEIPDIAQFDFPDPDQISLESYQSDLAATLEDCTEFILSKLQPTTYQLTPICLGGDHIITFPSLLAHINLVGAAKIGYIQIDSHGDSNTFASSPTGNFHGMFTRPFYADFDCEKISQLIKTQLKPEQIMYIGNLDLDPEEQRLFTDKKIQVIDQKALSTKEALASIQKFIGLYEYLHISLDIDVFDESIAPGTGIPAKKGFLREDILPILELLFKHPKVSLDLVEVNPKKDKNGNTVRLAQEILSFFISPLRETK